jgi:hypothetical protein
MNKKVERTIIIGLALILVLISLSGCAGKPQTKTNPSVYDGSIGTMLGCIFAPNTCKDIKKKANQDELTKEWEEVDKAQKSK